MAWCPTCFRVDAMWMLDLGGTSRELTAIGGLTVYVVGTYNLRARRDSNPQPSEP